MNYVDILNQLRTHFSLGNRPAILHIHVPYKTRSYKISNITDRICKHERPECRQISIGPVFSCLSKFITGTCCPDHVFDAKIYYDADNRLNIDIFTHKGNSQFNSNTFILVKTLHYVL